MLGSMRIRFFMLSATWSYAIDTDDSSICVQSSDAPVRGSAMLQSRRDNFDGFTVLVHREKLTEEGWKSVVGECCWYKTNDFIKRELLPSIGLEVCDEGCHNGIVPFFHCKSNLSFATLRRQVVENSQQHCACYGKVGTCQKFPDDCPKGVFNPDWNPQPCPTRAKANNTVVKEEAAIQMQGESTSSTKESAKTQAQPSARTRESDSHAQRRNVKRAHGTLIDFVNADEKKHAKGARMDVGKKASALRKGAQVMGKAGAALRKGTAPAKTTTVTTTTTSISELVETTTTTMPPKQQRTISRSSHNRRSPGSGPPPVTPESLRSTTSTTTTISLKATTTTSTTMTTTAIRTTPESEIVDGLLQAIPQVHEPKNIAQIFRAVSNRVFQMLSG